MKRDTIAKISAAGTMALMSIPSVAFAADADFETTVGNITDKGNDVISIVAYGLLALVAAFALFSLCKEILPALFARERPEFSKRVTACIVIIVVCIFAAFAPTIIDSITATLGSNVDLGTATR